MHKSPYTLILPDKTDIITEVNVFEGDFMSNAEKYVLLFLIGGIGYGAIEIAFRGFTHWSMVLTGGAAFLSLYLINDAFADTSIFIKAFLGMAIITALELTVGLIVNRVFALEVWDYSNLPANFMGQISLQFSACWYGLSVVAFLIFENFHIITNLQKS